MFDVRCSVFVPREQRTGTTEPSTELEHELRSENMEV
jgi:hypothetical protein